MELTKEQVATAYSTYGHLVLRRCRLILRHEAQAHDALQEVFMRLMRYGRAFSEASSPLAWLYRVADRVCISLLNHKSRREAVTEDGSLEAMAGESTAGGESTVNRDLALQLLAHFDARTQQVALMHFLDEIPQEQIAEELGWSRQTVNAKVALVRRRALALKKSLGVG